MSANSGPGRARAEEGARVRSILSAGETESVLVQGPAMSGKQKLAVELLSTADDSGGQPMAITTADTADQMRDAYWSFVGERSDDVVVVSCLPTANGRANDEWTREVDSPGDLTGIAMAVSKALETIPDHRQRGSRLLVDNVAPMLMYAELKPVYRFLHATVQQIETNGGAVVATLDTDGADKSDIRSLVGLFDHVVETRRSDGATEFRISGHEELSEGWHQHHSGGVGR